MDTTNQTLKTLSDADADIMLENFTSKAIKILSNEDSLLYEYFIASPYMADFDDLNSNEHKIFLGSYSNFTPTLKNFIAAGQTAEVVYRIGREYNFSDSKISKIGATIRELLVGSIFIKDFPAAISLKLGINEIKAGEITNKIISQSFGPIIEDVKRIQRSKFPEKIMQLQKEGRPTGLNQTKPPVQASPMPGPQQPPQTPRSDIRPPTINIPATEVKPLDSKPLDSVQNKPTPAPQKPPTLRGEARPEERQFKIPDLGQPVTKENGNKTPGSLEEELEKVANIIDLRNKPKE